MNRLCSIHHKLFQKLMAFLQRVLLDRHRSDLTFDFCGLNVQLANQTHQSRVALTLATLSSCSQHVWARIWAPLILIVARGDGLFTFSVCIHVRGPKLSTGCSFASRPTSSDSGSLSSMGRRLQSHSMQHRS